MFGKKKKKQTPKKSAKQTKIKTKPAAKQPATVEIVGFNEALKRSAAMQRVKEINRNALNKRINELTEAGVPKEVAKVMAQVEREYNLK